jgi:hypothetical protein
MSPAREAWRWAQLVQMAKGGLIDDAELDRRERLAFGAAVPSDYRDLDREDAIWRDREILPEDPA